MGTRRRINGELFGFNSLHGKKSVAKKKAERMRKEHGVRARVLKSKNASGKSGFYAVWVGLGGKRSRRSR